MQICYYIGNRDVTQGDVCVVGISVNLLVSIQRFILILVVACIFILGVVLDYIIFTVVIAVDLLMDFGTGDYIIYSKRYICLLSHYPGHTFVVAANRGVFHDSSN